MRNVSLVLLMNAAYRDGFPQSPGRYELIKEWTTLTDAGHARAVANAVALAQARFAVEGGMPAWADEPGEDVHRMYWPHDGLGGALILSSAPQVELSA